MCLTLPGKIKSIKNGRATVENGSRTEQIELGVVIDAKVGDWVLYATDRAVRLIDETEAREIIELLEDHYHPVDIAALPLDYKKIIYKVRKPDLLDQRSKTKDQKAVIPAKAGNQDDTNQSAFHSVSLGAGEPGISKADLEYLLNLKGNNNLEALYSEANVLRKDKLEDFVCIHGIIEFSNYCRNNCLYCGIRADADIRRYRMSEAEIFMACKIAVEHEGYKLIVLQSGEDFSYTDDELIHLIDRIKKNLRVFVFLSVGERSKDFYQRAFDAGATGSLFRFETSNPELYAKMHPKHTLDQRLKCLKEQIEIGYYVATGGLVGLPGQTISDMADDLLLVKELGVPMLSSGPWIESKQSPLLTNPKIQDTITKQIQNSIDQNINGEEAKELIPTKLEPEDKLRLILNYIAAARLLMPEVKIPITTALETLDPESGRHKGLLAGANALMFNITPERYRADYNLYDHKYIEREKVWQKYGLFKGEESYEMLDEKLRVDTSRISD